MTWRDDGAVFRLEELQQQLESVASGLTDVRATLAAQDDIGAPQQLVELDQGLAAIRDEVASLARSVTPADEIEQMGSGSTNWRQPATHNRHWQAASRRSRPGSAPNS